MPPRRDAKAVSQDPPRRSSRISAGKGKAVVSTMVYRGPAPSDTEPESDVGLLNPSSNDEGEKTDGDMEPLSLGKVGRGLPTIHEEEEDPEEMELEEDVEDIEEGLEDGREDEWNYLSKPGMYVFAPSKKLFHFNLFPTKGEVEWATSMMRARPNDWEDQTFVWHLRGAQQRLSFHIIRSARNKIHERFDEASTTGITRQLASLTQIEKFAENFDLSAVLGCDKDIQSQLPLTAGEVLALLCAYNRNVRGLTHQVMCGLDVLVASVLFENVPARCLNPGVVQDNLQFARMNAPRGNGTGYGTFGLKKQDDIVLTSAGDDDAILQHHIDRSFWSDCNIEPAVLLNVTITRRHKAIARRIEKMCPRLTELLCKLGLACKIKRLCQRKGRKFWLCQVEVKCAGVGFKRWEARGRGRGAKKAIVDVGRKLLHNVGLDFRRHHFK
ncbi:hypothetical protein AOL_s00169g208 [Orbilia oligospora ATCC 24927]|uniref:Uncharacterized protein n=1 Tax=Arthrobotrys oligospora (strain ATCC 24927 / CBS 115.81 / DSM 1491) TaxID=756982 RepID=G1XN05_ARTOA|nr:hypothetical protein AOL_s00169g208 [Orbilia oligospora ATCC 24927]EGX45602.1 hypothetical protein AOL_s00169g208 [Orbilia oligospora ATCC 24927]